MPSTSGLYLQKFSLESFPALIRFPGRRPYLCMNWDNVSSSSCSIGADLDYLFYIVLLSIFAAFTLARAGNYILFSVIVSSFQLKLLLCLCISLNFSMCFLKIRGDTILLFELPLASMAFISR